MADRRSGEDRRDGHQARFPKDDRQKQDRRQRERRTKDRIPVKMWIHQINQNESYYQQTGNLSMNGMYILAPNPFPLDTEIAIEFQIPGTTKVVSCKAAVKNVTEEGALYGISVKFSDVSTKDKKAIQEAVEELLTEYWYINE